MIMKELIPFINSAVNRDFRNATRKFLSEFVNAGYANGYVAVPPEHPWYRKSYDDVEDLIDVHGGVSFADTSDSCCEFSNLETINDDSNTIPLGWWVFGFDTLHWGDNLENWSKENCIAETLRLKQQLEEVVKSEG